MKILAKRAIAIFIDSFLFGVIYEVLRRTFPDFFQHFNTIVHILIFSVFCFKDILLTNASIGKAIVGICIYDVNWNKPKFYVLIKRAFLMLTVGYVLFCKIKLVDGNIMRLFEWEQNVLKTVVIDRRVYKKIDGEAKGMTGDYAKNMTELYNMYLRDLYLK